MAYIGKTPTPSALTASDIADGIISSAKIADSAVSTAKIADDAVTSAKVPANAIGTSELDQTASYDFSAGLTLGDNLTFDVADKGVHLGTTSANAAKLIHDYEEGTFTPTTNIGFASVTGEYVKIGNMVHFAIVGQYNAGPGDGSQASSIGGLPFSADPSDQIASIWVVQHNEHVIFQIGGTSAALKGRGDGVPLTSGQIGSKYLNVTGTYHIDL